MEERTKVAERDTSVKVARPTPKSKSKKKKWTKKRHAVVRNLLCAVLKPYSYAKYGIRVEKFKEQRDCPYLILFNHQTPFDQFFVGMAFRGPVYYLASEDIFSNGFVSSLIRFLVEPIPIKKQTADVRAVMNCIKVSREGGTIAIAPEGNRTYSGRTEYVNPSVATLARKLGMPIALYRLEGGYGVQPRWSDSVRRGRMRGYVARVIEPEEYRTMTDAELADAINELLYVDEAVADARFEGKKLAEYLERAVYVCPYCGLSSFESHGNFTECKKCGRRIEYLPTKELRGVGFDFPYRFVADWYDAQKDFVNSLDLTKMREGPVYRDTVDVSEVIVYKKKLPLCKRAELSLYGDRIELDADGNTYVFSFDGDTAITVLGRNKLNIYSGNRIYQIKGERNFNALKYVNFCCRYKNIVKGDENDKFLGI